MATLPEKIRKLDVLVGPQAEGHLLRESQFVFTYDQDMPERPAVGLFMPRSQMVYRGSAMFPVMDQNLPEGFLMQRLRDLYPKQELTVMHLLALVGSNGIGRVGFRLPGAASAAPQSVPRATLLHTTAGDELFEQLVEAYLSTGVGIAGVQPKVMVVDRATVNTPNVIVKWGAERYPGLAANEFVCLTAAKKAGIDVPGFDLSDDGKLLLLDRFDLADDGATRLGFEDVAALMQLQVRDVLSERKYRGSYEKIADVLKAMALPAADLERYFWQVCFSAMVRNGDGHLKNYGVLYTSENDIRLSPMFDVVTTAIYPYERYGGGPLMEDNTMALKLFGKDKSKTYPLPDELQRFGREVCGVGKPARVMEAIAQAMNETLGQLRRDERMPEGLLAKMQASWQRGPAYAQRMAVAL